MAKFSMENLDTAKKINAVDARNENGLFRAIKYGANKGDLEHLVCIGGDWNSKNIYGQSVLHVAVACGHHEAVKYFAGLGANINELDNFQRTPAHCIGFARVNFMETFIALKGAGAGFTAKDVHGNGVLFYLVFGESRTKQEVEWFLDHFPNWQLQKNEDDQTLLHLCAMAGNINLLQILISLGADVNVKTNIDYTPLHACVNADKNFLEIVDVLVANGANLNEKGFLNNTLLFLAAALGKPKEELEQLVSRGADWNSTNQIGGTILHMAAQGGNVEVLRYFLELGVNPDTKDNNNVLPLHLSVKAGKNSNPLSIALIEVGHDVSSTCSDTAILLESLPRNGLKSSYARFLEMRDFFW